MIIAIGSDHAGYEVKEKIKEHLLNDFSFKVNDMGAFSLNSVDYPEFGHKVGEEVSSGRANRGVVVCGSGIGISIAANKIKGIRAALCTTVDHAILSRKHNDANILALGARLTHIDDIYAMIKVWFNTDFEKGRHLDRINLIEL